MEIESKVRVIARCKRFEKNRLDPEITSCIDDLELHLNAEQCENVLFRFAPSYFKLDGYKVKCNCDSEDDSYNITLFKDEYVYIVKNVKQILSELIEGYFKLKAMNKLNDIIDFDYSIGNTEYDDEFDEE